ncbi:Ada metal-binding domain-containing protein [Micromonospora inositola]|uniref:Ada metal-binding domain-containing protein n=1 Tax=Micromonospora inositola TaxID=47865 RepID=UPI000B5AE540
MLSDPQSQYEAIQRREERLDGSFLTAVKTTGTYCRPSCRAKTPRTENVDFHPTAASAQLAGYRACKRSSPDAAPPARPAPGQSTLVGRAGALIEDGVVNPARTRRDQPDHDEKGSINGSARRTAPRGTI